MTTYCSKAKLWSKDDMIIYHVQKEDEVNHPYVPVEIPKMKLRTDSIKESAGLYNFFRSNVEAILP